MKKILAVLLVAAVIMSVTSYSRADSYDAAIALGIVGGAIAGAVIADSCYNSRYYSGPSYYSGPYRTVSYGGYYAAPARTVYYPARPAPYYQTYYRGPYRTVVYR